MFEFTCYVSFLVLQIFVGLEELVESVIELNLLLLHGHENFQRVFKFGEFFMLVFLLENENANLLSKGLYFCGLEILVDGNQNTEHAEHIVGAWLGNVAQKLFNVSVGSQENL